MRNINNVCATNKLRKCNVRKCNVRKFNVRKEIQCAHRVTTRDSADSSRVRFITLYNVHILVQSRKFRIPDLYLGNFLRTLLKNFA